MTQQGFQSRGVVGMLMGYEDAVKVIGSEPHGLQGGLYSFAADSAVQKEPGIADFQKGAVAAAAAGDYSKAHIFLRKL